MVDLTVKSEASAKRFKLGTANYNDLWLSIHGSDPRVILRSSGKPPTASHDNASASQFQSIARSTGSCL
jgi:hypothetical protein